MTLHELVIWEPCDQCEEFWCNLHMMHAHECECRDVIEWGDLGIDPYCNTLGDLITMGLLQETK